VNNPSLRALAARQLSDYRARRPGTFFAEPAASALDLADAYAVQGEVASVREAAGDVVAGYKIGCTGPRVIEQFGMDGPIRGFLFESEIHRSGAALSFAQYDHLAIEGEFAIRMGDDGEIDRVFPVIELHNYVFRGPRPTLPELVANNGIHAGLVVPVREIEWSGASFAESVSIEVNGHVIQHGLSSDVPGGPAGSLAWLKSHLAAHGLTLRPRQLVLTGTPLGLIPVHPGDRVVVTTTRSSSVEARITP